VTLDALDAGLHVLVEKPLCVTVRDAETIVARAQEARRVVQVGYMKRFDPAYEALLERLPAAGRLQLAGTMTVDPGIGERLRPRGFVDPGDVGPEVARALRAITAEQVAEAVGSDDPRHVTPFSDAFLGALVHDVNLVLGVCDDAWRVTDAAAAADGSLAYGAWASGGGARWTAVWLLLPAAGTFSEELRLFAANGVLGLRFPAPYHGSAPAELRVDGEASTRWRPAANAYVRQLEHFHACVTRGIACRTPAEQGARDVALLTDLYRAAVTS
jgi:predicted dehydrogenase